MTFKFVWILKPRIIPVLSFGPRDRNGDRFAFAFWEARYKTPPAFSLSDTVSVG